MVIFSSYVKLPEGILYIYILYYIIIYCIHIYIYIYTYSHHVSYMVWFKTNDCFVCNITIILITMIVWAWCFIIIISCCVYVFIFIYIYISYLHYYFNMSTNLTRKPGRWDLRCGKRSGRSWTWHVSAETGISSDGKVLGELGLNHELPICSMYGIWIPTFTPKINQLCR